MVWPYTGTGFFVRYIPLVGLYELWTLITPPDLYANFPYGFAVDDTILP